MVFLFSIMAGPCLTDSLFMSIMYLKKFCSSLK